MELRDQSQDKLQDQQTRARLLPPTQRRPIIQRTGNCNVTYTNISKRHFRYLRDIYTTLVDIKWRWTLFVFFMGFIICWLIFAFVWYVIMKTNEDDLYHEASANHTPCIMNVQTFTAAFLFSIETQHTIGYGYRYTTEECPFAIVVMCLQSITGVILQAFMVGVVFAKLTRPKKRTNTLFFSQKAIICLRDGVMCLMFRVADMRKSFIIGANVKAQVIHRRMTREGEEIPFYQGNVPVKSESGCEDLFFIWPLTIVHTIDEESPFYSMSAVDLINESFELVVYMEGTDESTGNTMQARCSYRPPDIAWGHRFVNFISYDVSSENYVIDFSHFETTEEVPMPLCSAKNLKCSVIQNNVQHTSSTPNEAKHVICLEPDIFQHQ